MNPSGLGLRIVNSVTIMRGGVGKAITKHVSIFLRKVFFLAIVYGS